MIYVAAIPVACLLAYAIYRLCATAVEPEDTTHLLTRIEKVLASPVIRVRLQGKG